MRRYTLRLDWLRSTVVAAAALAGTCLIANPAPAQIFAGTEKTSAVAMPSAPDAHDPGLAAPAAPQLPADVLRFLPSTLDGLRIAGETGDLRWPVYLTATQASDPLRFRLGYMSAVSILPDTSKLVVRVNDQEIGTDIINAPRGLRTVEFALPAGLMHEGYNAITLSVQQRHRVDCSVTATYELWTKIDPSQTGLVMAIASRGITDVTDIPALLPKPDGSLPIHILLAGKTNPPHLQRLIRTTEAIALAGHMLQPVVDFDASSSDVYGVDLVVGTRAALAGLSRVAGKIGATGPLLRVVPSGIVGRPIIVVTGSNDPDVDEAITSLADVRPGIGAAAGLVAADNYPAFKSEGGETLGLRQLGVHSQEFSGRYFRKSFNLMLPADFLASDYGRGTFDLAGGYAAGLARGAQVRVDVNGKSSGIIKLPYDAGDVFRHNQLFLPLGLMRPGLNRIDVFAETPRPEDATCAASEAKRFLFLDTSTIVLPVLARVQRLPDLAEATAGGMPFAQGNARLVVPKPDRDTIGSALSLTARAAVAAGKIIPFAFSTKMPQDDDGSTLVVSAAQALDPAVMATTGLDPAKVEAAWRDLATPQATATGLQGRWWLTNTDGPAACHMPSLAKVTAPVASMPAAAPAPIVAVAPLKPLSDDLLENWTGDGTPKASWLDQLQGLSSRMTGWFDDVPRMIHARIDRAPYADGITQDASLILAQGMSRGSHTNVTTIVTAPDSATLHAAMGCLFDPQVWSKLHGRLATLDGSSGAVIATDATSFHYVSASRVSLANSRLVLAGWFSLDPVAFVAVAMLMALCLSGTTLWFVRGVGRRSE